MSTLFWLNLIFLSECVGMAFYLGDSWAGGSQREKREFCRPMPVLLICSGLLMQTWAHFSLKCQHHEGETFPRPPYICINEIFRLWVFSPRCPGGAVIILSCEVHQCLFISTKQAAEPVDICASQSRAARVVCTCPYIPCSQYCKSSWTPPPLWSRLFDHCFSLRIVPLTINIHVEFQPEFHLKFPTADFRWTSGSWSVDWEPVSSPRTETIKPLQHVSFVLPTSNKLQPPASLRKKGRR